MITMNERYKTTTIEDTELIYSILREKHPNNQIDIEYNYNTKEYIINLSDLIFKNDPEVPLDIKMSCIYGDSCIGNTPLILRDSFTGLIHIETIESIMVENIEYPEFKLLDTTFRSDKTYSNTHYEVWTDKGWNKIKKVIRHKTHKKIYKILTNTGMVEVTEDHSLLDSNCNVIKPNECNTDTLLLNSYPNVFDSPINNITKNKAILYGFFLSDGVRESGIWSLNNSNLIILKHLKDLLEIEYPNVNFTINDVSTRLYVNNSMVNDMMVNEYNIFYDMNNNKKVPTKILNSNNSIIQSFLDGYFMATEYIKDKECTKFNSKGKIGSAGLYFIIKKLSYKVSIKNDKEEMIRFTFTNNKQCKINNKIKKIRVKDYGEIYVYDLETELGRFNAGVGDIQIKNTDSIFLSIKFNRNNFQENRKDAFKLAIICGDKITEMFNRDPINLEFEKVYQPFILLTKKRYIGNKYEDTRDPLKLKTLTTSGIAITKRNYCNMVKKCYKEVIDIIMDSSDLEKAILVYKKYIDRIDNYQIDQEDLVISAQIGKEYSCKTCKKKTEWIIKCDKCKTINNKMTPICSGTYKNNKCNKKFECLHTFSLGHINLAQRFLFRNEEICIGDRIQYIFVESNKKDVQKSELTEDPTYAKLNCLKYNRGCYLEQLAKSVMGFFKVVLQNEDELTDDLLEFTNEKLIEFGSSKLKISDFKITDD